MHPDLVQGGLQGLADRAMAERRWLYGLMKDLYDACKPGGTCVIIGDD